MLIGIDASRANVGHKTGVEWFSWRVIEALSKLDDMNLYELYLREDPEDRFLGLSSNFETKVLQLSGFWRRFHRLFRLPPMWTHMGLARYLKRNTPDILFIPANVLPRIYPKRSVVAVHDVGFDYVPQAYTWKERQYLRWSVKQAVRRAWKIITISEKTKQDIVDLYRGDPDSIHVLYPGYDKPVTNDHQQVGVPFGPYMLYVGRLHPKKDLETLIHSFSRLLHECSEAKGWTLVLGGSGEESYTRKLKKLVHTLGMSQWIRFVGYVDDTALPTFYQRAEVYVQPSKYEGFGMPVIEAMAHDCAVVVSDGGALPEVAGPSGRVFAVGKQDELLEHLKALVRDPDERERMKKRGRKRSENFSWEKCAGQLLEIFNEPDRLL